MLLLQQSKILVFLLNKIKILAVLGCRKLTYYPDTELKTVAEKKELTTKISSKTLCSFYLFGFNGKENDNEVKGDGCQQDYGMRISDTRLGRFLSVDPLTAKYPMLTPYQFASNRPIDGIDLDGLEFSKTSTFDPMTGVTTVTINVKIKIVKDTKIIDQQSFNNLKAQMQSQFSAIVGGINDVATNTLYAGNIEFSDDATLSLNIYDQAIPDNAADGMASGGAAAVATGKLSSDNSYSPYSNKLIAINSIEEVFHMGGVEHPASSTNTAQDAKIENVGGRNYVTTPNTLTPQIYWNVMQYGFPNIDGENVNCVRGSNENRNIITPDQIKVVENNIDQNCVNGEANN